MATEPSSAFLPLSVAPFDEWTYADVVREVKAKLPQDIYAVRKAYAVDKDHLRRGLEWVGPGDAVGNDKIKAQFAPEDAVGEVTSNVANAFSEPQLGAVPLQELAEGQTLPDEIAQKVQEAKNLLSNWWDANKLQELIQKCQETGAWAGVAGLRLWIPARFLLKDEEGTVYFRDAATFEQAMTYIRVMAPLPDVGTIVVDDNTQDVCAVYLDEEVVRQPNGRRRVYKRAELVYLDPERDTDEEADTIIRIVYADRARPDRVARLKLKGRLLFTEMQVRSLLTDPVIRTQRQLNLLTTLITRLAETAAFRERYIKNAKPQGFRIPYTEGDHLASGAFIERDEEGREWAVLPQERTLGANTTTELVGLPEYNERGERKGYATPDVFIADPVDPKPYLEAIEATRRRILRMCGQGHLGGISNAEASGIAYEQARAVFEKDLNHRRVPEEGMLRDLLTAVLTLAEVITNRPGYFTDAIRITVDQRIDPGPRSPDLVRLDLESLEAGVLSEETVMARIGVEDVNAEMVRVSHSARRILELLEKVVAAGDSFDLESLKEMLVKLNVPADIINSLVVKEENNEPEDPGENSGGEPEE